MTAALVMEAQASFRLGRAEETETAARRLLTDFPASAYAPNARYLFGLAGLLRQSYDEAAGPIVEAWETSSDSLLRNDARLVVTELSGERLTTGRLRQLADEWPDAGWLRAKLVERYLKEGDRRSAQAQFDLLRSRPGAELSAGSLAALEAQLARKMPSKIGILLPDGEEPGVKALAAEVLDGVRFALQRRLGRNPELELDVRESAGDTASASRAARALAADDAVVAVLGPLFSSVALTVAPVLNAAHVPMISPTALADGLAATGPYVVQLNPDQSVRGAAMARYAVEQLGLRKLAVLTDAEPRARLRAESFRDAAAKLGAAVVAFEVFAKDSTDLRTQFMSIRQAGAVREPSVSFEGKMSAAEVRRLVRAGADPEFIRQARRRNETVPVTRLFGPRGREIADSLGLELTTPEANAADLDVAITSLDGLYLSLSSSDEMGIVAPQLSYFNIHAQLLGSEEWNEPQQLEANRRYVDNMLIAVDAFVEEGDSAYDAFARAFRTWKGSAPGRNALYGYDAMCLLLDLLARGGMSREALAGQLEEIDDDQALHLPVRVRNRVNTAMHIVKYERGSVKLIRTVTSQ